MDEFLNPKSMITPGAAGSTTMAIAIALGNLFGLDRVGFLELGISFLFGLIVFGGPGMAWHKKLAYYVINSLIIFCVAAGITATGFRIESGSSVSWNPTNQAELARVLGESLVPRANAASTEQPTRTPNGISCRNGDTCSSNYCRPGPQVAGGEDLSYCIARDMDCTLPGFDGVPLGFRLRKDGAIYECLKPDGAVYPALHKSRSTIFKQLF